MQFKNNNGTGHSQVITCDKAESAIIFELCENMCNCMPTVLNQAVAWYVLPVPSPLQQVHYTTITMNLKAMSFHWLVDMPLFVVPINGFLMMVISFVVNHELASVST